MDVCHRILALAGRGPVVTSRDAIEAVAGMGALSSAEPYRQMVGLRNLLVHRYEFVDLEILAQVLNGKLGELETFRAEILAYAAR